MVPPASRPFGFIATKPRMNGDICRGALEFSAKTTHSVFFRAERFSRGTTSRKLLIAEDEDFRIARAETAVAIDTTDPNRFFFRPYVPGQPKRSLSWSHYKRKMFAIYYSIISYHLLDGLPEAAVQDAPLQCASVMFREKDMMNLQIKYVMPFSEIVERLSSTSFK